MILRGADEPPIWHPVAYHDPMLIGRIAIPFLALSAAWGAAFVSFPEPFQTLKSSPID
jgi:hypothetical protein